MASLTRGIADYGSGSALPGATYSVVYVGTNSSVTVSNMTPGTTYYAGVDLMRIRDCHQL